MPENEMTIENVTPSLSGIQHRPQNFGFTAIEGTGKRTKILIADSGAPDHKSIGNISDSVNFSSTSTAIDIIGHSTALSGLIGANKKDTLIGLAPDANLYFTKATDDKGAAHVDAIIASILWGIVKDVHVIVLPIIIGVQNSALQEAISKAVGEKICIIMATSNDVKYTDVLNVVPDKQAERVTIGEIKVPYPPFYTTYTKQRYAKAFGKSCAVAVVGAVCALLIEQNMKSKIERSPIDVYKQILGAVAIHPSKE